MVTLKAEGVQGTATTGYYLFHTLQDLLQAQYSIGHVPQLQFTVARL